jgi:hypothetical protein
MVLHIRIEITRWLYQTLHIKDLHGNAKESLDVQRVLIFIQKVYYKWNVFHQ